MISTETIKIDIFGDENENETEFWSVSKHCHENDCGKLRESKLVVRDECGRGKWLCGMSVGVVRAGQGWVRVREIFHSWGVGEGTHLSSRAGLYCETHPPRPTLCALHTVTMLCCYVLYLVSVSWQYFIHNNKWMSIVILHTLQSRNITIIYLSLIHIWRCRRIERCRSRWSPYH